MKNILMVLASILVNSHSYSAAPEHRWGNANNTVLIDLTNLCVNETRRDLFLPKGSGVADALAVLLSSTQKIIPVCDLYYHIAFEEKTDLMIIVFEFPDIVGGMVDLKDQCGNSELPYIILKPIEPEKKEIDVCQNLWDSTTGKPLFVYVGYEKIIAIKINGKEVSVTMKITSTAGRALDRLSNCNRLFEIPCTIGRDTICINAELLCDKNINCGVYNEQDEDYKICRVSGFQSLWIVVLAGLGAMTIIFTIIIYSLKERIAVIPDNFFIFSQDEQNLLILKTEMRSHIWEKVPPKTVEKMSREEKMGNKIAESDSNMPEDTISQPTMMIMNPFTVHDSPGKA